MPDMMSKMDTWIVMTSCVLLTTMYCMIVLQAVLQYNGISMWGFIFRCCLQAQTCLLRRNPTAEDILRARAIETQSMALQLSNAALAEANACAAVVDAANTLVQNAAANEAATHSARGLRAHPDACQSLLGVQALLQRQLDNVSKDIENLDDRDLRFNAAEITVVATHEVLLQRMESNFAETETAQSKEFNENETAIQDQFSALNVQPSANDLVNHNTQTLLRQVEHDKDRQHEKGQFQSNKSPQRQRARGSRTRAGTRASARDTGGSPCCAAGR